MQRLIGAAVGIRPRLVQVDSSAVGLVPRLTVPLTCGLVLGLSTLPWLVDMTAAIGMLVLCCRDQAGDVQRSMEAQRLADELERELASLGTAERAEKERAYLKSDLRFLGASVPAIRAAVKRLHREHPEVDHDGVVALAVALWDVPVHERRMAAAELLDLRSEVLTPADLPMLERLLRESRTWALVDGLAASVVGGLRARHPEDLEDTLERWSEDPDHWMRRASLLAYLVALRRGDGDFDGFARKADRMLDDREPFIRKAIGWVLRDTGKRRPELVVGWLEPRAVRAAGLTIREAVKHLPDEDRERILRAAGR